MAAERHAVLLRDGDTFVWKHGDDMRHKQGGMVKTALRPGPPCRRPRQTPPHPGHWCIRATTNRRDAALFTNQARCLVSEPEARAAARRAAVCVHVPVEQRAEARLRPHLPAPPADDGRGGGARCGATSGGCGARREEEEPTGVHAQDEQARARVKCTGPACVRSRGVCMVPACVWSLGVMGLDWVS